METAKTAKARRKPIDLSFPFDISGEFCWCIQTEMQTFQYSYHGTDGNACWHSNASQYHWFFFDNLNGTPFCLVNRTWFDDASEVLEVCMTATLQLCSIPNKSNLVFAKAMQASPQKKKTCEQWQWLSMYISSPCGKDFKQSETIYPLPGAGPRRSSRAPSPGSLTCPSGQYDRFLKGIKWSCK